MIADDTRRYETAHGQMLGLAGDQFVSRSLELYGEFSGLEWHLFSQFVTSGMTVLEIGANIGTHTVPLAKACAPGPLYAFEPQQRVFQLLCANLALNGVKNAVALPEACGDREGHVVVPPVDYGAAGNFGGVSVAEESVAGAGTKVRLGTIDALDLPECHFVKIDVEGFEPAVLRGAAATIARHKPILYVENDRVENQQEVISLIDEMGYTQYWHAPALYDADNFRKNPENVFPGIVSLNLLCIPRVEGFTINGGDPIDPDNWRSPIGA
jgi:FkbM family methyltransferase